MQNSELLPIYLVVGPDKLKQNTVVERLQTRLSSLGDLSINSTHFDAEKNSVTEIINLCNTLPFMAEKRLVRVENADKIKSDKFIDYCKKPNDNTILLLQCEKLARNTKLYKALKPNMIIKCDLPKAYQFVNVVESIARKNRINISLPAAQRLVKLCGQDTVLIDNQIRKIKHATLKTVIDIQDVIDNVENSTEPKPWEFVNAFASKNLNKCLDILGQMKDASEFILLNLVCKRVRELVCAKTLTEEKKEYQLASILGLQNWQVKNHISDARRFKMSELKNILYNALNTDAKMKSGGNPKNTFEDFVICSLTGCNTNLEY